MRRVSHAEAVVQALLQTGGTDALERFVRDWRRHFLEAMNPQHLPPYWCAPAASCSLRGPWHVAQQLSGSAHVLYPGWLACLQRCSQLPACPIRSVDARTASSTAHEGAAAFEAEREAAEAGAGEPALTD
jgi:hypothetical protein